MADDTIMPAPIMPVAILPVRHAPGTEPVRTLFTRTAEGHDVTIEQHRHPVEL